MFSVHLHIKLFPLKQVLADSTASLVFLHKNHLLRRQNVSRSYKNQSLVSFCSLVNIELSGLPSKAEKRHKIAEKSEEKKSFTVSYLIDSCGLSPETATSASEKVCFGNSEKPNSVLTLLENYGFSKAQISIIVRKRPKILVSKEQTLLPKLEFFESVGMSKAFIASTISRDPTLLTRSLENQIIPNYKFLKSVLSTNERVAGALKRTSWIFLEDVDKSLAPNIKVLREFKVPDSCVKLLLTHYPETLMVMTDDFKATVSEVLEMGFSPSKSMFVLALHALSGDANKLTWARCYESYSSWGWSKDDIHMAFRKHPNCMIMSQKKISKTMDFLVNKMGWDSRMIASCPTVIFFNLENRIIPRCSVAHVLLSRGLIVKDLKLSSILLPLEKSFLKKFVSKYEEEVPKLYDFYKGKVGIDKL